jgi:hypothetical protein
MSEPEIRLFLRVTARVSSVFFVAAFTGRALEDLQSIAITQWLARQRDFFLLGFATSHTVHLGGIVALALVMGWASFVNRFTIPGLAGGGLIYVLIYALAQAALARRLQWHGPSSWAGSQRFEAVSLYVIWTIFALGFVGGSLQGSFANIIFALMALAAPVIRISAARNRRLLESQS